MSQTRFHIRYCSLESLPYVGSAITDATNRNLQSLGVYEKKTRELLFELQRCDVSPKELRQMDSDNIFID
jgi:hypothetical protein